jgi:ketosteroid isomerase-like protein
MSSTQVELLEEMYAALNRQEIERASEFLHDEAELHQLPSQPDADSYFGREEFLRGVGDWHAGFEPGLQYEPIEMEDAGDRVLMSVMLRGRGRQSGVQVEQLLFHVWEFRDDRPFRCWVLEDRGEARKAAGLAGPEP